jgi:hypothetical protein
MSISSTALRAGCDAMHCAARDAMLGPMRCELVAMQCAALHGCDARADAVAGAGGAMLLTMVFFGGFFWDRLNTHQCPYVTGTDRRVEGWI